MSTCLLSRLLIVPDSRRFARTSDRRGGPSRKLHPPGATFAGWGCDDESRHATPSLSDRQQATVEARLPLESWHREGGRDLEHGLPEDDPGPGREAARVCPRAPGGERDDRGH